MRRSDLDPDILAEYKRLSEEAMVRVQSAINRGDLARVSTQHGTGSGEFTPISCVDCGQQAQHYDHRDYLEPLVVVPVCQSCNYKRGMAVDTIAKHPEYWADFNPRNADQQGSGRGRPAKGQHLTPRFIRLDDDVWAECQKLRSAYGTINELLSAALAALRTQEAQGRVLAETGDPWKAVSVNATAAPRPFKRGPRPKGDKSR